MKTIEQPILNQSIKPITRFLFVFLIITAAFIQLSFAAEKTITFSRGNVLLETIFKEIHKQTGYRFIYTNEMMSETKPVNVQLKDASLEEALKQCLSGQPLTYTINQTTVVIKRKQGVKSQPLPPLTV